MEDGESGEMGEESSGLRFVQQAPPDEDRAEQGDQEDGQHEDQPEGKRFVPVETTRTTQNVGFVVFLLLLKFM